MLDVSPETESRLREFATREGLNTDEVLARLLDKAEIGVGPRQCNLKESDDEKRARVLSYLNASPEEIKRLNAPTIALLDAQMKRAQNATPEEALEAERDWEEFKGSINETRQANGERILYPEVDAQ